MTRNQAAGGVSVGTATDQSAWCRDLGFPNGARGGKLPTLLKGLALCNGHQATGGTCCFSKVNEWHNPNWQLSNLQVSTNSHRMSVVPKKDSSIDLRSRTVRWEGTWYEYTSWWPETIAEQQKIVGKPLHSKLLLIYHDLSFLGLVIYMVDIL